MRFSNLKGVPLMLAAAIAALWLAATGQLSLYIHPRYVIFTAVFAVIALWMTVFGSKYAGDDEMSGSESTKSSTRRRNLVGILLGLVCVFGVVALLVAKPATLTSATATQRGVNTAAVGTTADMPAESPLFGNEDYSNLTVKDWSGLLSSTNDPDYFVGKKATVTGFIVASPNDSKNVFYVSRFVVTCCIVDARPIGLPVYMPDWKKQFHEDQWVNVSGNFALNPSSVSMEQVAVIPDKVEVVDQPERVYDY